MVDWGVAFTIFIAILAASLVERYFLERGSMTMVEKQMALKTPTSVEEYVQQHYPNAY